MRLDLDSDDLVTGEAVALDLPAAGFGLRAASGMLDLFVGLVALWLVSIVATGLASGADGALAAAIALVAVVGVVIGIPTTVETLTRGKSLGKLATGTRTVRDDAGPIQFRHALVRALVGVVELYLFLGIPALITSLVSSRGKRMGDYAAGTYVVRERFSVRMAPPTPMPPHLAGWAASADIAALPDGLAMTVRQFLARAASLSPQSRADIGAQLYADVVRYVAPAPPPGHPEYLLAAVLADRRRRDTQRLWREAELRARLVPPDPLAAPQHPSASATWGAGPDQAGARWGSA